jgi:hypothetical protein
MGEGVTIEVDDGVVIAEHTVLHSSASELFCEAIVFSESCE